MACCAVADWRELLGKVDLVSVCSPAVTHADIVRAFLNAGAHVLVEKPIATTVEEAARIGGAGRARPAGSSPSAIRNVLFSPAPACSTRPKRRWKSHCWRRGPWTGRGDDVCAVLDLMIHDLDLVHTLVQGPVADVQRRRA